ncbi:MAG: hypothetical protein ACJ8ER_00020 [Allosphingosinicella sp.]
MTVTLACLVGAAASAKPKRHEASSNALIDAVAACRSIAEEKARLACYDAASAQLAQAVESQSLVVLDQQAIKETRRSLFGFTLPDIPFLGGDSGEGASQLETTIAAASPLGNGRWQIRLEDGAVWQTTEASLRLSDPKAGQKILIKRGALGNYFMRINGQLGIRGRRIS